MDFTLKASKQWMQQKTDCLVISLQGEKKLPSYLNEIDQSLDGQLTALFKSGDLKLSNKQSYLLATPKLNSKRLLFIGTAKDLDLKNTRTHIQIIYKAIKNSPFKQAAVALSLIPSAISQAELIKEISSQCIYHGYQYDETLSKKADKPTLKQLYLINDTASKAEKQALTDGIALGEGLNHTRELGNLPPSICTPSYLAKSAQALAKDHPKLSCKILSEAQMQKLGMNALLSVSAGSNEPGKLIVLEYKGGKANEKPQVLVGKGVTFDAGGISLKPGLNMDEMKYDMCGAASVLGTFKALTLASPKLNVVGIVGAVENLPSGSATKPGDVVTSMSGQTIEILNTDAEGRLVLCDALTYAERFKPAAVIDIATLTGACIVALGKQASGLFSNDEDLQADLIASGQASYDRVWPMPIWEEYDQLLKSNFADMANIGGPQAGSITAACFLARFTQQYKWAHIDIAGPAWISGANKGATGRPVNLLFNYLLSKSA